CGHEPVAVLFSDVILSDVVRILAFDLVNDERSFNDAVFDGLGQRIVANDPWEIGAVLIFRCGRKIEPKGKAGGQSFVDGGESFVPLEVLIVNVMSLVIEDDEVRKTFDAFKH